MNYKGFEITFSEISDHWTAVGDLGTKDNVSLRALKEAIDKAERAAESFTPFNAWVDRGESAYNEAKRGFKEVKVTSIVDDGHQKGNLRITYLYDKERTSVGRNTVYADTETNRQEMDNIKARRETITAIYAEIKSIKNRLELATLPVKEGK